MKSFMVWLFTVCLLADPICLAVASNGLEFDLNSQSRAVQADEWMKTLNDTLPFSQVSLPGTHDSGAMWGGEALCTQRSTFVQQLEAGIRAFDVRLKSRQGKLGVYHSIAFQRIYWEEDVFPVMIAFLQKHPSETLVVSLKCEGGNAAEYTSLLAASLQRADYRPYVVSSFHKELTVGECRGKILFLHRDEPGSDYPGAHCEGWQDDASCVLTLRAHKGMVGTAWLQDEYQYSSGDVAAIAQKKQAIIQHFEQMAQPAPESYRWGISFISATGLPQGTPALFAKELNGAVAEYLTNTKQRYCGIVFIDFVADADGQQLVDAIIRSNHR